jgi:CTP synthase
VLICRTERPLDEEVRQKLSMFCNVPLNAVVEARDVAHTIYEMPLMLQREKLDDTVCRLLGISAPPANMEKWAKYVDRVVKPKKRVKIAVVGKYIELQDAYKSIYESLTHAGAAADCGIDLQLIDAEECETSDPAGLLGDVAGILVPGGFGDRGVEGKIRATQFAREQKVPFLGLCLGMQVATIEFARNVVGLTQANSTEFDPQSPEPVICLLPGQRDVTEKGASMRLGNWPTLLREDTKAFQLYGKSEIRERHRHRYEFNMAYRERMEAQGFVIAGTSPEGHLVELIELRDHPYFLACQYHPEFMSKPNKPHPLFKGFVSASLAHGS